MANRVVSLTFALWIGACASAESSPASRGDGSTFDASTDGAPVDSNHLADARAGDAQQEQLDAAQSCQGGKENRVCNQCGIQERSCIDGAWSTWGTCIAPPCCASDIETRACGMCGSETRRCEVNQWSRWGACVEGTCCKDNLAGTEVVDGPAGLMVQTHTANDLCALERALDHICQAHQRGTGEIKDLVLTDSVKTTNGMLTEDLNTDVLGLVLRYAHCVDNLFIGTMPEVMLTDPYAATTLADADKRWQWLRAAKRVAEKLRSYMATQAPAQAWHWYVSYEANLNAFSSASYRGYYEALLLQHTADLKSLHGSSAILWSPTFWTDPDNLSLSAKSQLTSALTSFFSNVPAISWVAVQDHLGLQPSWTCDDALEYYSLVKSAGSALASVQLNVEYFTTAGGSIRDGDPSELAARVTCYRNAGASLGASFDFRYWYGTHGH